MVAYLIIIIVKRCISVFTVMFLNETQFVAISTPLCLSGCALVTERGLNKNTNLIL